MISPLKRRRKTRRQQQACRNTHFLLLLSGFNYFFETLNLGSGGASPSYHFSEIARIAEQQFLLKYSRALARGALLKNSLSVPVRAEDSSRFRNWREKASASHVDLYTIFLSRRPTEFR
jgi:hypothetical protein